MLRVLGFATTLALGGPAMAQSAADSTVDFELFRPHTDH